MDTNRETLQKIANLARLELREADESKMLSDLNRILDWVDKLSEIDTSGVEPLTHMTLETNVLREDVVSQTLSRQQALANAPHHDGVHFRVPKVIE